jgi:hypothetical protein
MHLVHKNDVQQIAYGEVYAPNRPDAQGEFMTREHIRKMAHDFLRSGKTGEIDMQHNNRVIKGCAVVESFIAEDDDPRYIPGAWVVGVHIPDKEVWGKVVKGELNGFSMEAMVNRHEREVEIEIPPVVQGLTSKSDDGHEHRFYVTYDDNGQFKGGVTDEVNGHSHRISHGTHTNPAPDGHTHRFSSVDTIQIAS